MELVEPARDETHRQGVAFPDDVPSGSKLTLTDLTVSAIPV